MRYSFDYRFFSFLKKLGFGFDAKKSPEVSNMLKSLKALDGGRILFEVTIDEDGSWAAEAINLPGLITGGSSSDSFDEMITDAIFTYYNVPARYCDDSLLIKRQSKNTRRKASRKLFSLSQSPIPAAA